VKKTKFCVCALVLLAGCKNDDNNSNEVNRVSLDVTPKVALWLSDETIRQHGDRGPYDLAAPSGYVSKLGNRQSWINENGREVYTKDQWEVVGGPSLSLPYSVVLKDSGIRREASGTGVYRTVTTGNITYGRRVAPFYITGECGQALIWQMGATGKGRQRTIGEKIGHPIRGSTAEEWAQKGAATTLGNEPAEEGYILRVWGSEATVTEDRLTATYRADVFDGTNTVWTLRDNKRTHVGTVVLRIGTIKSRRKCVDENCPAH